MARKSPATLSEAVVGIFFLSKRARHTFRVNILPSPRTFLGAGTRAVLRSYRTPIPPSMRQGLPKCPRIRLLGLRRMTDGRRIGTDLLRVVYRKSSAR